MDQFEKQLESINNKSWKKSIKFFLISIVILAIIGFAVYVAYNLYFHNEFFNYQNVLQSRPDTNILKKDEIKKIDKVKINKFKSEKEFKEYLQKSKAGSQYAMYGSGMRNTPVMEMTDSAMMKGESLNMESVSQSAERVSETNVQVLSIDEPDIVKTNGEDIYYAQNNYYGYRNFRGVYNQNAEIKIIKAFPRAELEEIAQIDKSGDLFLYKDTLV
ncbi:beta-propeller domain-containing protein, partial [bacterium]|nr:beta-propeller domain-containing protein [bacterium]